MNRFVKTAVCSLALAAVAPSFAAEAEDIEDGAVGYTPFCISLASPVAIPWGNARWDVFGLDLGVFYTDTSKMYGLDVTAAVGRSRNDMKGLMVSGLANWNDASVYGMRVGGLFNYCAGTGYGLDVTCVSVRQDFWGLDVNVLGTYENDFRGVQISGLANISKNLGYGWTTAGIVNYAPVAYGFQLAGIYNHTEELHGCQIALVNFAETCPWGFQIGLVNIILDNTIKVLPIVNAYF